MLFPSCLRRAVVVVFAGLASVRVAGEERSPQVTGSLPLQLWRLEERGASSINWAVTVHPATGFVYVANQNGLLEFDGTRWQLAPLPRGGAVRSVVVGPEGKVWLGGSGQICVLEADAHGALRAVDRGGRLPEFAGEGEKLAGTASAVGDDGAYIPSLDTRLIGDAPQAIAGSDGVYFVLPRRIARFRPDGGLDVWAREVESRVPGWWSDGALHVVHGSEGIFRHGADGAATFVGRGGPRVLAAGPHPAGGALWLAAAGPIHVVDGRRRALASEEAAALFRTDPPRCALVLPQGASAFGTINHGLVVLDADGRIAQVVNRSRGLPANRINGLAADREGGVWLAMHAGLVRVQLATPLALHGLTQGLSGNPWDVKRLGERVYVAHSEGVAWRDPVDGRFHAVTGLSAAIHQLAVASDELLAAGLGLHAVRREEGERALALTTGSFRHGVAVSRTWPGRIFHFGPEDVQFWRREADAWKREGTFSSLTSGADDLCDDGKGFVWVVTRDARLRRIDGRAGLRAEAPVRVFGPEDGLPVAGRSDRVRLLQVGGELLVTSRQGAWRWDGAAERFLREERLGAVEAGEGPEAVTGGAAEAWLFYARPEPRVQTVRVEAEGKWSVSERVAPALTGLAVHSLFADDVGRTLWIAAQGQLVSLQRDGREPEAETPVEARLRRVRTLAGETLWQERAFTAPAVAEMPVLTLGPRERAVRIEFTAVTYRGSLKGEAAPRFRTRVEGIDAEWSAWTNEPYRELTNLPDGSVTFELQTRDLQGRESAGVRMRFEVLPPWWRTGAARVGGAVLALGAMAGVVGLRTRALRRRSAALERLVAERTEELRKQNAELARLRQLELDEAAAARLAAQEARLAEEKAHLELLRYQLNPHFLLNAFTTLRGLVFSQPAAAGEMASRLATFCRLALTRSDEAGATVAEEAKLVETYLETERARWREMLRCSVEVEPLVMERRLPPFLLQPLVENAVKYGGQTSAEVLHVQVRVADDGEGGLRIEVANTGAWVEPGDGTDGAGTNGDAGSTRIGLENLKRRLRRYYPEAHQLDIEAANGWVRVRLHLRSNLVHEPV